MKGFSRRGDMARVSGLWWLMQARDGSAPWLWRVPSDVNPADLPTRPKDGWAKLQQILPTHVRDEVKPDWARIIRAMNAADLKDAAVALGLDKETGVEEHTPEEVQRKSRGVLP